MFLNRNRAVVLLAALFLILTISPEPSFIEIAFLGDVMLGRGIAESAARNPVWEPFKPLEPVISRVDILAANLESPLTSAPAKTDGYVLCAPPGQVDVLDSTGFDLLTLANNHILDCGETGKRETIANLTSRNIKSVINLQEPVLLHKNGRTIAFLALDDVSAALEMETVIPLVHSAAEKADIVIVSIHWGGEYQPAPSTRQKKIAFDLAQAGADVIIGHHPHVIQPVGEIQRVSDGKTCLVVYSLGNALFDQHALPDTRIGEAVNLIIDPTNRISFNLHHFIIDPDKAEIAFLNP